MKMCLFKYQYVFSPEDSSTYAETSDGIVLEGHSAVNESALTGESIPGDKEAGDELSNVLKYICIK